MREENARATEDDEHDRNGDDDELQANWEREEWGRMQMAKATETGNNGENEARKKRGFARNNGELTNDQKQPTMRNDDDNDDEEQTKIRDDESNSERRMGKRKRGRQSVIFCAKDKVQLFVFHSNSFPYSVPWLRYLRFPLFFIHFSQIILF